MLYDADGDTYAAPYASLAAEKRRAGGWNEDAPFYTLQNALQFGALEDGSIDLWSQRADG